MKCCLARQKYRINKTADYCNAWERKAFCAQDDDEMHGLHHTPVSVMDEFWFTLTEVVCVLKMLQEYLLHRRLTDVFAAVQLITKIRLTAGVKPSSQ